MLLCQFLNRTYVREGKVHYIRGNDNDNSNTLWESNAAYCNANVAMARYRLFSLAPPICGICCTRYRFMCIFLEKRATGIVNANADTLFSTLRFKSDGN